MRQLNFPQSRGLFGVERIDITPPVGIYHRMWGAAKHDQATGIHRNLTATILVVQAPHGDSTEPPIAIIALDHCLFWHDEMNDFIETVCVRSGMKSENIRVFFSHTHAAGLMGYERADFPGGELIRDYLRTTANEVGCAVKRAYDGRKPATCVYGWGSCSLATNRDYLDEKSGEYVCGFNPLKAADQTLLVGRISTDADQQVLATLVNYACHPTTLAWDNTLISPDYLGAMREVVEDATDAPCLFIQGASGDVGPFEGFVGSTDVADRNGRQLGYAALSAITGLPPAGHDYCYSGEVVSGATIGTWAWSPSGSERLFASEVFELEQTDCELEYREDLPTRNELEQRDRVWADKESAARSADDMQAAGEARAIRERIRRRLSRIEHLDLSRPHRFRIWLWKFGDAIWVALDGEHYNLLQTELRSRFPESTLVIGTLSNGSQSWYLPDRDSYGLGLYQETASVLARGSLESLIDSLSDRIGHLIRN